MENFVKNNIELLSPAGSFECAKAAINAGADAIYMGGSKFGARAFAKSVEENTLVDAIKYSKDNGKKFYLTVNTLFKQKELKEVFLYLDDIVKEGIDAFIVQDLGVAMMLKERYIDVELHASTQMTITSSKAVNLVKNLGFKQVVLARELTLKEIKAIKKEVGDDIKLEAFVHGSMCYCYSGACLMSSFIGGESGNRGRCKGPCRLPYEVASANSKRLKHVRASHTNSKGVRASYTSPKQIVRYHHEAEPYILSMKDMCALNSLEGLINAGVTSFKIEGRMRQPEYVAGVTKTYRKYIDYIVGESSTSPINIERDEKYLLELYNKGGFTNYYDKHNGTDMIQRYERR